MQSQANCFSALAALILKIQKARKGDKGERQNYLKKVTTRLKWMFPTATITMSTFPLPSGTYPRCWSILLWIGHALISHRDLI